MQRDTSNQQVLDLEQKLALMQERVYDLEVIMLCIASWPHIFTCSWGCPIYIVLPKSCTSCSVTCQDMYKVGDVHPL